MEKWKSRKRWIMLYNNWYSLEKTKDIKEPVLEFSFKSVDSDTTVYLPKNFSK